MFYFSLPLRYFITWGLVVEEGHGIGVVEPGTARKAALKIACVYYTQRFKPGDLAGHNLCLINISSIISDVCCSTIMYKIATSVTLSSKDRRRSLTYTSEEYGSYFLVAVMTHRTSIFWSWRDTSKSISDLSCSSNYCSERWCTYSDGTKLHQ
jgi:hypothetical protein